MMIFSFLMSMSLLFGDIERGREILIERAKEFVEDRDYSSEIYRYILGVIEDESFQEDPDLYMSEWKKRRGLTKEYRIAEDTAMYFFNHVGLANKY